MPVCIIYVEIESYIVRMLKNHFLFNGVTTKYVIIYKDIFITIRYIENEGENER